jgi:sarcosine oxidase subunit alpha
METGAWLRPQWFPEPGESDWMESVVREVNAVRTSVGLSDVSTLGKIDVQGPDAGLFLDRLYTNTFSTLAIGRARYGLMLREDGFVFDDGTTSRLGPEHFLVTTTTAHAAAVLAHMEHALQVIWPDLDVQVMSVTEQWAQYAVAGPKSRDVLARVVDPQHDISNEAFPYMGAGAVTVSGGIPARLFRISFSGELAYELAVPARYGDALVRRLMEAGAPEGITPYGLETLGAMRIEKGHVAGGELNGQTTARDLGLGKMVSTKKDFIGRVMAARPVLTDPMRPTLVGIRPVDRKVRLGGGGHFLEVGAAATAGNELGHMTSVAYSPTFSHWIGLGLLKRGHRRHGDTVRVWDGVRGRDVLVEVVDPCFYDPKGERLRA